MANLFNEAAKAIAGWLITGDSPLYGILIAAIELALLFVAIYFILLIGKRIIRSVARRRMRKDPDAGKIAKIKTVQSVAASVFKYTIYFLGAATALDILGLGVTASSLLATAGIGGLAVGFGAQSLIKDIISGAFLLFERQFVVGDTVEMASAEGVVEEITLRVTHIRGFKGELIIIPNGQITHVINHSRGESLAVINVEIPFEQDLEAAYASIRRAGETARAQSEDMLEAPNISGVTGVQNSIATVRVTCRTRPSAQWRVEWLLQSCIMDQFIKDGIRPPYPHMVHEEVYPGEDEQE